MSGTNINNIFEAILEGKYDSKSMKFPSGSVTFAPANIDALAKYLADNWENKTKISPAVFNFIQDLFARIKDNKNFSKETVKFINIIKDCNKYEKRQDLINEIKLDFFNNITDFKCFDKLMIQKFHADVFTNISNDQFRKIDEKNYKYLLMDQYDKIMASSKLSQENKNKIKAAVAVTPKLITSKINKTNEGEELSLEIPETSVMSTTKTEEGTISKNDPKTYTVAATTAATTAALTELSSKKKSDVSPTAPKPLTETKIETIETPEKKVTKIIQNVESSSKESLKNIADPNIRNKLDEIITKLDSLTKISEKTPIGTTDANFVLKINNPVGKTATNLKGGADIEISVRCLMSKWSGSNTFLKNEKCPANINDYFVDRGNNKVFNTDKFLVLTGNFDTDWEFYKNVHKFIVSIGNFITTNEFKNANPAIQANILNNYKLLIKKTIEYSQKFMDKHQVINEEIINMNYSLILLYNMVTVKHASTGRDISKLQELYDNLNKAILTNIELYKQIDKEALVEKTGLTGENLKVVDELINNLTGKLEKLTTQQKELAVNQQQILNQSGQISTKVNSQIVKLANEIGKITTISKSD